MQAHQRPRGKPLPTKRNSRATRRDRRPVRRLLSLRSTVVLQLAALTGIGAAFLLHGAHRSPAEMAIGGLAAFAAALKLINDNVDNS
jgi:hypothetical protein